DGKFRKEHGEEPLRECFQQRTILRHADLDNPICHLRIVDRVVDVIQSRRQFSLALQFQVHRQRLRPPALLRSHAAAPLKLQPFDDDFPSHGSILKDWISGCQYIVSGVCEGGWVRPGGFLARRTRTMKQCSFDARSKSQSGHTHKGGGRVAVWFRVLGVGGGKGGPSNPLCSRHPHDEKDWKDTHVGPALPERAPSEGPRSTAALGPTWVSFREKRNKQVRKGQPF